MINEKLKTRCKNKKLSQLQMAKLCAMEQTTYSRKESGKALPMKNGNALPML